MFKIDYVFKDEDGDLIHVTYTDDSIEGVYFEEDIVMLSITRVK